MKTTIQGECLSTICADPSQVWKSLRDYGDLSWADGIEEVRVEGAGIGMLRKVRLTGTQTWIDERLTTRNDEAMNFSYAIEGEGLPGLENYRAEVQVEPAVEGCAVRWRCFAEVDEDARETMLAAVQALAEGIVTLFARQFDAE